MAQTDILIRCEFCSSNFHSTVNGLVRVQQQYEATCPKCERINSFVGTAGGWTDFVNKAAVEARTFNKEYNI
jgi:phage FluMu protein Com